MDWNAVEAVATSVGAGMAGSALIATVVSLRMETRRRREDMQRIEDARIDAEAAQARLVVARHERQLGSGKVAVTLANFSTLPVSSLTVRPNMLDAAVVLADGCPHPEKFVEVLDPGESVAVAFTAPYGREHEIYAETLFTDGRGLRWRRIGGREPARETRG